MSDLEVRKIPFEFEGAEFIWNPENPAFSIFMNQITFYVIGFEKFACKAMRAAEAVITDPAVAEEARLFREQEIVHSLAHRKHAKALFERYPELEETLNKTIKSFDELFAETSLKYQLAYAGGIEAVFTPFFKMILDNRETLYKGGDARLASLFLWHFCEEVEHRSSALMVYDHVVGSYLYRLRHAWGGLSHSASIMDMIKEDFKKHVHDVPQEYYDLSPYATIPFSAKVKATLGVLDAQMFWHNPDTQPLPDYYDEWMAHWNAGDDVTQVYGKPVTGEPA